MSSGKFMWYNTDTGERVESDDGHVQVDYDRHKDESVVYLGDTTVSIATLSGDIDMQTAVDVAKECGWTVIEVDEDE